jgi:hypothetical protein
MKMFYTYQLQRAQTPMTIKRKNIKSTGMTKVTFDIEKKDSVNFSSIELLTEENKWNPVALKKLKNGKFQLIKSYNPDNTPELQFIYKATKLDGSELFITESDADGCVDNGIGDGGRNAVLKLAS